MNKPGTEPTSTIDKEKILQEGKRVLEHEARALASMAGVMDRDFVEAVTQLHQNQGRLVITGVGKSALVAQKMAATLNSTGSPALFMHAADAVHGDLGMVQTHDHVLCISKSGNTAEIKVLVPLLKARSAPIVGMTAVRESYLGQECDYLLHTPMQQEACPHDLAPTTSTSLQMAMGDALAVCLLQLRQFSKEDFARHHPGGALGKQLYLRVGELARMNEKPSVRPEAGLKEVILEITSRRLGATAILDEGRLVGMITDGDLRRMLELPREVDDLRARDIMNPSPLFLYVDALAVTAREVMREKKVSQLIVQDHQHRYLGMVHIHDLNREGIL